MNLADAVVLDASGTQVVLGDAWRDRDAILIFVRHFACAGCSDHVAELRPRLAELDQLGVNVVLIGSGTAEQLATFVAEQQLAGHPIQLFTDPTLAVYRAAELGRSWSGTIGPRALGNLAGLILRGHSNGRACGDLLQQGGTMYVRRGGEVAFVHRSQRLGDHAPISEVVQIALARAVGEAGIA
jgi:peroxiredoxin